MDHKLSVYVSVGDDGGGRFALARGVIAGLLEATALHDLAIELVIEGWRGLEERQAHLVAGLEARQASVRYVPRDRLL